RELDPLETAVVTAGTLHAGTVSNVIPQTATLTGPVRTYTPETRDFLQQRLTEMSMAIAQSFRATAEVIYLRGYPAMINDPEMTAFAESVAKEVLGEDNVHYGKPIMAGEDLAYVLEKVPGCMISLGTGNPDRG